MEELEYITLTLINGQVLISKMSPILNKHDYYTMINPVKPILLPESNKVALVQHNPFSESIEFQIHATHILTMGALDVNYVEMYDNAVNALHKKTKKSYDEFLKLDELDDLELDDEDSPIELPISKTLH